MNILILILIYKYLKGYKRILKESLEIIKESKMEMDEVGGFDDPELMAQYHGNYFDELTKTFFHFDSLSDELVESMEKIMDELFYVSASFKMIKNDFDKHRYVYFQNVKLEGEDNKIICLDNLPNGLVNLNCSYNQITLLDNLPNSLLTLNCNGNIISSLDNLPCNLKNLTCIYHLCI